MADGQVRRGHDTAPPRIGIDGLLFRLERVQKTGNGWRADCPSGHKSRGTLSVSEADDGRTLLHCFAGCSATDVLGALDLTLVDVMPERLRDPSPEGRKAAREAFKRSAWSAALGVVEREARVVLIAAGDLLKGQPLAASDVQRLGEAVERIADAREALA
ncbi:MAG: DNA primase [Betaproteobacteria bacterium]|nr:DNA primase [Betaproteobacteria bacterium]